MTDAGRNLGRLLGLVLVAAAAFPAAAQEEEQPPASGVNIEELRGVLEGEAAQSGLLRDIERAAEGASGAATPDDPAAPEAAADDEPPPVSIGERVTRGIPGLIRAVARDVEDIGQALAATVRGLRGFAGIDMAGLARILRDVAPVFATTVVVAWLARIAVLPLYRRIGMAADRSRPFRTALLAMGAILLDVGTIAVAAAAGFAVGGSVTVGDGDEASFWFVYLIAFVAAGFILVVIRAIFSPATPLLRPLPMDDAEARYWHLRLGGIVCLVAFGELFIRPLVAETVSAETAQATLVAIYFVTAAALLYLILRNRNGPPDYFARRATETDGDVTFTVLAWVTRYWHFAAIPFLGILLHQAVTSGEHALPLIYNAAEVAAAFAVGAFLVAVFDRWATSGVRLPEGINKALPTVEPQINAFMPGFMQLLRLLVLVLLTVYTLQVVGVLQLTDWLETRAGIDVLGATTNVVLIVLAAFVIWLLVSSWIDSRLTPRFGRYPTARERTLLALFRNATLIVIMIVGLAYALSSIGISIAPLLASAGVVGLAIGFGSQRLVQDIITGIFIQFENAINVGDFVEAGGKGGTVEKLTIRSVSLRDVNGVYHVVPFSSVDAVSNHMKGFSYHVADIRVAYREDIDQAKALMIAAYDDLRADPENGPKLFADLEWFGVNELGESAVVLRARLKTMPGEQWAIGRAFSESVKKRFDAAGVQIPFPHVTLWFGQSKDDAAPPANLAIGRRTRSSEPRPTVATPPDGTEVANRIRADSPTDAGGDGIGNGGEGHR